MFNRFVPDMTLTSSRGLEVTQRQALIEVEEEQTLCHMESTYLSSLTYQSATFSFFSFYLAD